MKKLKYQMLFTIVMMTIGIAAVTTNLSIGGTTPIAGNPDDFDVYITAVDKANENDAKIVINSKKSFSFTTIFSSLGELTAFDIYITNASKNYDASVTYDCDYDDEYIYLSNRIDTVIPAREERMATLDVKLNKAYAGEDEFETKVTCEIVATAIERTELSTNDEVSSPVMSSYNVGDEIAIDSEKFNIISQTDDTVSMLAQHGVGFDSVQSQGQTYDFYETGDWGTPTEYMDINIQNYNNDIRTVINLHVDFLRDFTNDQTITGDLISLKQLEELGCTVSGGYVTNYNETCASSPYFSWLNNGEWSWTKTVRIGFENTLWLIGIDGLLSHSELLNWCLYGYDDAYVTGCQGDLIYGYHIDDLNTVRPVITISKSTLAKYK